MVLKVVISYYPMHLFIQCILVKADFSASLLQPLVSHDPSEIIRWLLLKKHVFLSKVKTILML